PRGWGFESSWAHCRVSGVRCQVSGVSADSPRLRTAWRLALITAGAASGHGVGLGGGSGRSAARLARLVRDQEVGGSNPLAPTCRGNDLLIPVATSVATSPAGFLAV